MLDAREAARRTRIDALSGPSSDMFDIVDAGRPGKVASRSLSKPQAECSVARSLP
jgi:hypothetical protein